MDLTLVNDVDVYPPPTKKHRGENGVAEAAEEEEKPLIIINKEDVNVASAAVSSTYVRRCVCAHVALLTLLWRIGYRFSFIVAGGASWEFVVSSKSTYRV